MTRYFSSLRVRLTALVLLAMLPATAFVVHMGLKQRRLDGLKAEEFAIRLAQQAAMDQRRTLQATRQLLVAMAQVPVIRSADTNACCQFLADEVKRYSLYSNFAVTDGEGRVRCSAVPVMEPVTVAEDSWFQQTVQTRDFAVGDYSIGRIVKQPGIHAAYPLLDNKGRVQGVLYAMLNLRWISQLAAEADLPMDATVSVFDDAGRVLGRYPEGDKWVGQSVTGTALFEGVAARVRGTSQFLGVDGVSRLYGFVPLRTGGGKAAAYVVVGIPTAVVFAEANRNLRLDIGALIAVAVLALVAIHWGGAALIVRPIAALVEATKGLAAGELQTRAGGPRGAGELGQLQAAFDEMAASLERHARQLQKTNRALRTISECNQVLVRAADETELLREICRIIVEHGGYRMAWVGYKQMDAEQSVLPVAQVGVGVVSPPGTNLTWADRELGRGPMGTALRTGKPQLVSDVTCDPRFAPWRGPAVAAGYAAVLGLPLKVEETTFGALEIYAAETGAFDEAEIELLAELADDLAYGITALRTRVERQRAENRLQESERQFRSVVESSPMGMHFYELQADGRLVFKGGNRAGDVILGIEHRQLVGKTLEEAFPGNIGTEVPVRYREVCTKGTPWRAEHIDYRDEKIRGAFEVHAFQTGPNRMVALFFEITERRRAQEALQESERRFRELFEASPDAIFVEDLNGTVLDVNPAACRLHGARKEQLIGNSVLQLVPPDQHDSVASGYRKLVSGEWKEAEGYSWRFNGQRVPVEIRASHIEYGGQPALLLHVRDITERRRAEEAHRRLAAAVEQAVEGILITDANGTIQYVNPALEAITGYRRAELIGRNPRIFKSGKHDADFYRQMWEALTRGEVWAGFFFNRKKDGTMYQEEATISAIRDESGRITSYVAVKRDVTREIEMEVQLLQAQKMEAIGRLAGGLAHDFNNILTAITGYSELGLRGAVANEPVRRNIEEVLKAADRASALTRQLLAFSRKQVLEFKMLDLNDLIANLQKMLRRLIGEDIELITSLTPGLWPVKADPGQMEQVIMNMAINARDAMPLGGRVNIATTNVSLSGHGTDGPASLPAGDYVMLSIADNGAGMPDEVKAHLFEPFFTTKPTDKGTGLGLATCYGIVEQSGGRIEVESQVGVGTIFRVFLPRMEESLAAAVPVAPTEMPRSRGGETVLLVEDEGAVRELASLILSELGYVVLTAGNGVEALRLMHDRGQAKLDLLLTDVVMPQMGGRELAERMRQATPSLKVLFCSGYTVETDWVSKLLTRQTHFLQKPFTSVTLAQKVREALDA